MDIRDKEGVQKVVLSLPVDHSGTTVYIKGWRYAAGTKPPVILIHDLGEQTEHYRAAAQLIVARGYSIYLFDLRGHGRSGRRLGHAPSFDILVKDLLQVAAWVRHQEAGRAPVIVGHGVGALVAMDFTKLYGSFCRAAVLSAPCLELASEVTLAMRLIIKLLAELTPTLRIPRALTPRFSGPRSTHFPRLTAVFTQELLSALKRAEARFIEYHGNVLILCPDKDTICTYHHLKKSAALHNEHNLEIESLPGVSHAVFTDDDQSCNAALDVIVPWMERVLAEKPAQAPAVEVPPPPRPRAPTQAHESGDKSVEKPGATKA